MHSGAMKFGGAIVCSRKSGHAIMSYMFTKDSLKANFIRTLPVMAGYIVLGIGFGIVLRSKGFGLGWCLAMSIFIFAGSMQYVAVDLMAAGAGLITVALTTLLVNARHLFYGISMIDRYKKVGKTKPYLIFGLTDETYSLVCQDSSLSDADLFQITLMNQIYWVTGSIIGSVAGAIIPWDFRGVDFSLTALFVCIFTEQWLSTKDHIPALIGLLSSLICLLLFGASSFLIPSMIVITVSLTILYKLRGEKGGDHND